MSGAPAHYSVEVALPCRAGPPAPACAALRQLGIVSQLSQPVFVASTPNKFAVAVSSPSSGLWSRRWCTVWRASATSRSSCWSFRAHSTPAPTSHPFSPCHRNLQTRSVPPETADSVVPAAAVHALAVGTSSRSSGSRLFGSTTPSTSDPLGSRYSRSSVSPPSRCCSRAEP